MKASKTVVLLYFTFCWDEYFFICIIHIFVLSGLFLYLDQFLLHLVGKNEGQVYLLFVSKYSRNLLVGRSILRHSL